MNDKEITSEAVDEAIRKMIALGIMGRWWCERCEDWVPYRTKLARDTLDGGGKRGIAYSERDSRLAHGASHHA